MTTLIQRNTTIPTRKSETFLDRVRQSALGLEIHVLQGERKMAADNRTLGLFYRIGISSLRPAVRMRSISTLTSMPTVTPKRLGHDRATNKEQKITITVSTGLSNEGGEKMRGRS